VVQQGYDIRASQRHPPVGFTGVHAPHVLAILRLDHRQGLRCPSRAASAGGTLSKCGFQFPVMAETSDSAAVFKNVELPVPQPLPTLGD